MVMVTTFHGNSANDNPNWDKITHSLTKKSQYLEQGATLFQMNKKRIVNRIFLSTLWYIGQYTIYHKEN